MIFFQMRIPSEHFSNIPVFALGVAEDKEAETKDEKREETASGGGIFSFTASAKRRASVFGGGGDAGSGGKTQTERRNSAEESRTNMRSLPADNSGKKDPK